MLIQIRGARQNNLKNLNLDLPTGRLIVVTGLSGSGKSSLAFDILYAEGQRRYIETFSPYARQFFDRMDKPQVDSISGIPPAIAIEQRNTVKSTRSTVGTMTEVCDYMKLLWPHISQLHCHSCGRPVRKDSPQRIWEVVADGPPASPSSAVAAGGPPASPSGPAKPSQAAKESIAPRQIPAAESAPSPAAPVESTGPETREVLITFDLPLSEKMALRDSLDLLARQGYQRVLVSARSENTPSARPGDGAALRLEEATAAWGGETPAAITVVQDRVKLIPASRSRFVESCEQAYHFGKGRLAIRATDGRLLHLFSNRLHCAECNLEFREPSAALFSFNNPVGACSACKGFGRIISIDYNLVIPNRNLTLAEGAVKPWQTGQSAESQDHLAKYCRMRKVPMDVPFSSLSQAQQDWVIEGDADYGKDEAHEWPRAWYGVKGYFRSLESMSYKMHVRVLLSRYRSYQLCPSCQGARFKPESLAYRVPLDSGTALTLSDFYRLPVDQALALVRSIQEKRFQTRATDPVALALEEVCSRLGFLSEVGLGYLALDRPTRSLSGGETERVNLTTCLGSRLVNTLFVLDEPSVGLHSRDTQRLITILQRLRDAGNSVVVVEHEASVMRAADQILDLGPGQGETGGELVFQGSFADILKTPASLTGQYLSGARAIESYARRPVTADTPKLVLAGASCHNIRDLAVELPLGRLVVITGVSGSGKSTLMRDLLWPALQARLDKRVSRNSPETGATSSELPGATLPDVEENDALASEAASSDRGPGLDGVEQLSRALLVDQSPLGRTPRSNPAVYVGAFDAIRDVFAATEMARQRGLTAGAFSFNSSQGQCETCRGAGFEKIEMQFLSDVYIRCPACAGRRYRPHILEVTIEGTARNGAAVKRGKKRKPARTAWNIADLLDATIEQAIQFLSALENSRAAVSAVRSLNVLREVGLGYLRLGQPINTLSGGEAQRLKLAAHLAEFHRASSHQGRPSLFLFDEPTTGLHFDDVRVLLQVFQKLVGLGHSVFVIEHNLDVMKAADWIIDLGPEAGEGGGKVVAAGTPEQIMECAESHTGHALVKPHPSPVPHRPRA